MGCLEVEGPGEVDVVLPDVILDVFSRYIVGWTVQFRENGQLATALIEQATEQQKITPKILTLHADRGAPQRAKPVRSSWRTWASRRRTAGRTPHGQPLLGVEFKTLKYRPEFPARFDDIEHARAHCRAFVDWYNHAHRHSGVGLMTPAAVHHGHATRLLAARAGVLDAAYAQHPNGSSASRRPTRAANRRLDQQARDEGGRSLNEHEASHRA